MSGIDTQQWARTSPSSSSLFVPYIVYNRISGMSESLASLSVCPPSPTTTTTHSISRACKSSLRSQETRNIFSFQSWGHKTGLQTRLRRRRSECLKQKQTRWRTSLILSAPGNPPTRDAGYVHVACVFSPPIANSKVQPPPVTCH